MPLSSSKRNSKKAELPKLWLYRYGEIGSRIPVHIKVNHGKVTVTVDDENYFVDDTYRLDMVWLRDIVDDTFVEGVRHAFVLITPESEFMCVTNSSKDKDEWMRCLVVEILDAMYGKDHVHQETTKEIKELIHMSNLRDGEYTFSKREGFEGGHYCGGFADGAPKGNGLLTWPNGDVYEGEFLNGLFHGVGTRSWTAHSDYLTFNGEWENGEIQGYGEMKFCGGSVYRGWWHQGRQHGYGEMVQMDQKTLKKLSYYGAWVNGHRQGYGIEDNEELVTRYIGKWSKDSRDGPGVLVTSEGTVKEGYFKDSEVKSDVAAPIDVEEKWEPLFSSCIHGLDLMLYRKPERSCIAPESPNKPTRRATDSSKMKTKFKFHRHSTPVDSLRHDNGHVPSLATVDLKPVLPFLDVRGESGGKKSIQDVLQTTSHPLGMLLNKWSLCFIASYSGELGRHRELLTHALDDINMVVRTLHKVTSTYYPTLSEMEGELDAETKINKLADYFGTQDHIWLYRVIFPPILKVLMDLYRESVKETEKNFTEVCQKLIEDTQDDSGLAKHFGFGNQFDQLSSSGTLRDAGETLDKISSLETPTQKLMAINDSYKVIEKALSRIIVDEESVNDVASSVVCYVLVLSKVPDFASQLQFIQDFAGMALTFGDMGFAFKKLKDSYHLLLHNSKV